MLIYRQGKQMTVLVDPAHPESWRRQPYRSELVQMAAEAESGGGYLILFCGDEIVKIEPTLVIEPA
jgi:uncharacterized protein